MPDLVLAGGWVLDPGRGLDLVADVLIRDGRINAIQPGIAEQPDCQHIDVRGKVVAPGFIDLHVHAYGRIGFSDPDSIGVHRGTTSMVDAGGAGALVWDEFAALIPGRFRTDIFSWLYIGATGANDPAVTNGDPRALLDVPIKRLLDIVDGHREVIRGLKAAAYGGFGIGPVMMAKGVAKILDLPLYLHIGDIYEQGLPTYMAQVLELLEPGDIVTHCLTGEPSNLLDEGGRVLPQALAARDRGVLFDVGFGSFSVDFTVAERLFEAGLVPNTISSDLQQVNVTGPAFSLPMVMSAMMSLGLSLQDVVDKVTASAAQSLGLNGELGSLSPGGAADVTVFEIQTGDFVYADTSGHTRPGSTRLVPVMTLKSGEVFQAEMSKAEQEGNWNFKKGIARAEPPARAKLLAPHQRIFLSVLAERLGGVDTWEGLPLSEAFHAVRRQQGLEVGPAAEAVLDSFFETRFNPPVGWLLWELGRDFVLKRLAEVS